jgi:uncharacterized protein (UPF0276 family)
METKQMTQEQHFQAKGYYSHMLPIPSKEEALQHAINQIKRAFGRK